MAGNVAQPINEFLLEVRYSPNAKILDYRGSWAEAVSKHMELSDWQIVENRFDVFDKSKDRSFFVSYRNAGSLIRNCTTRNFFADQTNRFLRYLFEQKQFGDSLFVDRFGVRARFATPSAESYADLLQRYTTRYLTLQPAAYEAVGGQLLDMAGPIDFTMKNGTIKSVSGPMPKEQITQAFAWLEAVPERALFFDMDYAVSPKATLGGQEVMNKVKAFSGDVWDIHEKLRTLILG